MIDLDSRGPKGSQLQGRHGEETCPATEIQNNPILHHPLLNQTGQGLQAKQRARVSSRTESELLVKKKGSRIFGPGEAGIVGLDGQAGHGPVSAALFERRRFGVGKVPDPEVKPLLGGKRSFQFRRCPGDRQQSLVEEIVIGAKDDPGLSARRLLEDRPERLEHREEGGQRPDRP